MSGRRESSGTSSTVCPKFAAIDARRRRAGLSKARLSAAAGISDRAWRKWSRGIVRPRPSTLRALDRALRRLCRDNGRDDDTALHALYRAIVALTAAGSGLPAAQVLAADPRANRKGDAEWMRAANVRHLALYLLVTVHDVPMSAAAQCAGVSKQAVSKILRAIEDGRDNLAADRRLDALAAAIGG